MNNEIAPSSIGLCDLINAGLISAPACMFGHHGQRRIDATLEIDGMISYKGEVYASPSVAAGKAITATSGLKTTGRSYWSINGWLFWHITCRDGTDRTLAELRQQLLETKP